MKQNVLDVLMYLFQNYMDSEFEIEPDRDSLNIELQEAGFLHSEIDRAFDWLDELAANQESDESDDQTSGSIRIYTDQEAEKLDLECRGFLFHLERAGILSSSARELVIDRVMALETGDVDIERLKWVVLMVLFNQPEQDVSYEWIENVVFDNVVDCLH
jgi:Smg protein